MSTTNLIRWSGLVSLLAGVLYAIAALLHPVGEDLTAVNSPNWVTSHLVYWVSAILILFSLIGLYARQTEQSGRLGLVSFVLAFIGTTVVGSIFFMASTVIPLVAAAGSPAFFDKAMTPPALFMPVIILGFVLGYILFGITIMRAGVLPRWSGLLLIVGVSLFPISEAPLFNLTLSHVIVTIGDVLFGLGFAWMGYALWSEKREPALKAKGVDHPMAPERHV
jgi:hypothetical protein